MQTESIPAKKCLQETLAERLNSGVLSLIGHTPLIKLDKLWNSMAPITCYAKLEMANLGGSIKDRTAMNIILSAINKGDINEDTTIIESTSGNMGVGLARICHILKLKLIVVTDPHINSTNKQLVTLYGAHVVEVSEQDGNGGYLNTRLQKVQELLASIPNSYWTDQYHNADNPRTHFATYREIVDDLGKAPDYLFVGTSTGGTLRGFIDAVKASGHSTKVVAVDAKGSVIFEPTPAPRYIPGMGSSRPSDFLQDVLPDYYCLVSDQQCVQGCYQLLEHEGILAGGSSGAIIHAIQQSSNIFKKGDTVVGVLADNGERYLNTIYDPSWCQKLGILANDTM